MACDVLVSLWKGVMHLRRGVTLSVIFHQKLPGKCILQPYGYRCPAEFSAIPTAGIAAEGTKWEGLPSDS